MREEGRFVGEGARVVDAGCACAEEGGGRGVEDVAGLEHEGFDLGVLVGVDGREGRGRRGWMVWEGSRGVVRWFVGRGKRRAAKGGG